jgi:precorrin-2 dehydrogenase/sirohydrochlorin ferrochelatase
VVPSASVWNRLNAASGWVPLTVNLRGQRVVCVGAGSVAAMKSLPLLEAGAALIVVAPEAVADIQDAAADGRLVWLRRRYQPGDLDGALLAIAATANHTIDQGVSEEAAKQQVLCIRVNGKGTAALPAVVRRGPLQLAVSTSGQAPALARRLREQLERTYGPEWGELAALLGQLRARPDVRAAMDGIDPAERRRRWRAAVDALLAGGQPSLDAAAALRNLGGCSAMPISSDPRPSVGS